MRRIFAILALCLVVAGCAGSSRLNPVDTDKLAALEGSYGIALSAALAYRELPMCKKNQQATITNVCAKRSVILQMQEADAKFRAVLIPLRNYIKNNPTLDASAYFNAAYTALDIFQRLQLANGVL